MLVDLRGVAPGDLPNAVFDEFIAAQAPAHARSRPMEDALRDHLVRGVEAKVAVKTHGLNATKFKLRLAKLTEEIQRVGRINALLATELDQQHFDRLHKAFQLASELQVELDALRSAPSNSKPA